MEPQPPVSPPASVPGEQRPPRWGLGDFLIGLVGGYALATLVGLLWLAGTGQETLSLAGQGLSQIGLWTGFVGAVLVASHRKGAGRLAEDFGLRFRWSDLAVGVVGGLVVQLVVLNAVAFLLRPLLGRPEVERTAQDLLDKAQGAAFFGLVLSVVVGAPIVEELFFRGLLLRSLQRRVPDNAAVAISSIAFGLSHGSGLPIKAVLLVMISITIFGAILAKLAIRTGRLGPGIVVHAVFNLFTLLFLTFTK